MATKVGKFIKKVASVQKKVVQTVAKTVSKLATAASKTGVASAISAVNPAAGAVYKAATKPQAPQPKNMSLAGGGYYDDKGDKQPGTPVNRTNAPGDLGGQNMTYNTSTGKAPTKKDPILTYTPGTNSLTGELRPSSRSSSSTTAEASSLSDSIGSTEAPSTASAVSSSSGASSPIITTAKTGITGISNNIAANTANQLETDSEIQRIKKEQDAQDALRAEQEKKDKSFLGDLFNKTPQEVGEDAAERIGLDEQKYFQDRAAKEKEVEILSLEYNKVKEAMDLQIAQSTDKLASNNFINNQIAQIERNAAPKLNRIAADINTKQATLAQMRGDFEEARGYIKDAIAAATAEQKFKFDSWSAFREMNKETFNRLDSRTQKALDRAYDLAEKDYDRTLDQKDAVGELMLKYNHLGARIGINDTYEDAIRKASRFDPTPAKGGGSSGGSSGFKSADVESDVRSDAVDLRYNQNLSPEDTYARLRLGYSQSEVSDAALKNIAGVSSQPAPTAAPVAAPKTSVIDSISNWLFKKF